MPQEVFSVEEGLAKLAAHGRITQQEHDMLLEAHRLLEGDPMEKAASLKEYITPANIGGLLLGATMAMPYAMHGINKAIDPMRESIRYRRMRALPGAELTVSRNEADEYFMPEFDSNEEMEEATIRKAFGILHRHAPEITRTPELARQMLLQQIPLDPSRLVQNSVGFARGDLDNQKIRASIRSDQDKQLSNAAHGVKMIIEGLPETPLTEVEQEQAFRDALIERSNEAMISEYATMRAKAKADPLAKTPPAAPAMMYKKNP
jgi:hypothetical protein